MEITEESFLDPETCAGCGLTGIEVTSHDEPGRSFLCATDECPVQSWNVPPSSTAEYIDVRE
jgi:hypothetical protein